MDFWNVYERARDNPEFGSSRLYITSRDRIHLSLSSVEKYGTLLGTNQGISKKFSEGTRYIMVKDLTHDLFLSIYDVNTTQSFLMRFSESIPDALSKKIIGEIKKIRNPNLEMRIIGLQNKDTELLTAPGYFHKLFEPNLMEVDLFGNETRHIVFDMKLGMGFNLLLLNRIYRPQELVSTLSLEDFNKNKSEFKFE